MSQPSSIRYAIAGDHAGFSMKNDVRKLLEGLNVSVIDCGTHSADSCDFPDFAEAIATRILAGEIDRGILVCGSGVGVSVAANKFPGIRASLCHDTYSARQGVEHDDMNVLCIGARVIGPEVAFEITRAFLNARYTPAPRHAARLAKIVDIERRVLAGEFSNGEHQG
ncbi:MAG: ribose 5-phosphate isomerase B [Planctomycetota bacterium]|jgi:ribose 5-phosphate isomerase B|nr:ribose 5-phosphate isomerase B [Planctomycetota bacterium]